jgi:hypothetical protein
VSAKLLARTASVLASIDQALDDPFPAAVARLAGVAGSWWGCHRPELVQIGATIEQHDGDCSDGLLIRWDRPNVAHQCNMPVADEIFDGATCWADDNPPSFDYCGAVPISDLGLCGHHHDQITPLEGP